MTDNVTKVISDLVIQILMIFGFYILFHGELAPGGGFQAGAIFAVAMIFYSMVHGYEQFEQKISSRVLDILMAIGILIYAGTGVISLLFSSHYLNYSVFFSNHHLGQKFGIMSIETGVAFTVAAVLTKIYIEFSKEL